MTDQLGADFGLNIPGESGVTATGTTQATAYTLRRQVTVFFTVASGAGCVLPSTYNYGAGVTIMNRGANALLVYPPPGDKLESGSVNASYSLAVGNDVTYFSFTPALAAPPRQWWQINSPIGPNLSPTFNAITGGVDPFPISGLAGGSGTGGAITIAAGGGGSGGGIATFQGGAGLLNSSGANAVIAGGAGGVASISGNWDGGNVNLVGGAAIRSGIPGEVQINADANLIYVTVRPTAAAGTVFLVATRALRVKTIGEIHSVAAGGVSTLTATKDTGTTAPGGGTSLMTGSFDLNGTANTVQNATLAASAATLALAAGDRLALNFANAIQSSAGIVVSVGLQPI